MNARRWLPWALLPIAILGIERALRAIAPNRQPVATPEIPHVEQPYPQPLRTSDPSLVRPTGAPMSQPTPTTGFIRPTSPPPDRERSRRNAIVAVAQLTRWEWFKLRRRWMPWILLLILVLFSQLAIWATVFQYRSIDAGGQVIIPTAGRAGPPRTAQCTDVLAEPSRLPEGVDPALAPAFRAQCVEIAKQGDEQLRQIYATISLPGSIKLALSAGIGTILIAVLSASVIGVEYGWGTMRTTLTRGTGRAQYLAGKIAVLLLAALGALIVVAIGAASASVIAERIVTAPAGATAATWSSVAEAFGRAWFALVPMVALLVMLTVLTASGSTSMAIGIGYTIAEPILLALLGRLSDRFARLGDYLLAANISGWSSGSSMLSSSANASVSSMHHFIVLVIYTTVFTAIAFYLIKSRDVSKATGT
ncbi:MAG: hypothetical protein DWI48_01555 [Chloroflexi bacterium]|nr:MAG: hypothetical protein DWI48_01555 [Chloroflexota bacterium]